MPDWSAIASDLGVAEATPTPVSGGDISAAWKLGDLFLKTGPLSASEMFAGEAEGLQEIAASETIRVPTVAGCGVVANTAYIALEWLSFDQPHASTERELGERLAAMHRCTKDRFGWHRDNTIGLTPQSNEWGDDWIEFIREHRIGYQLRLAAENGFTGELQEKGSRLLKRLPIWFEHYKCDASLLHGDLWGGNWGSCDGEPVIFDPAVYFGDRESDLAMTRLFGGFGRGFYEAYEHAWPLESGHLERRAIYQLYHVLNHLNLFGSGYLGRAIALMDELL